MPATTPLYNADSLFNLLSSVEEAIAASLTQDGRQLEKWRRLVGWPEPPQDCCPEIAVWGGNLRNVALQNNYGMGGKPVFIQQWQYDVSIRVSECFFDVDEDGKALDPETLEEWSKALYRMQHQVFFGFLCRWLNDEITEIDGCSAVAMGPTIEHGDGGCGGFTFVVTVQMER